MKIRKLAAFLTAAGLLVLRAAPAAGEDRPERTLDIYFIDTEGGAATLIVTPAGESILVDAGNPGERDAGRIAKTAKEAGLTRIDHLITTHWHLDHVGGIPRLAELLPIQKFYDHGIPEPLSSDIRPQDIEPYRKATNGKSVVLKPGHEIPLASSGTTPSPKLLVVASDGKVLGDAAGSPPHQEPPCARGHEAAPLDPSDNARSVSFVLTYGTFRFFDGGDLSWNVEHRLVCPKNLAGEVDVYQVDHHGLDVSNNPALIEALKPRVAVLGNGARKGGEPRTFATLKAAKGLEAVFQLHRSLRVGDKENSPAELIANDDPACKGEPVVLSVARDGKTYTVKVPSKGTSKKYATKT